MTSVVDPLQRDRWARLRFSIIGPLLAAPPAAGELHSALTALSAKSWRHPLSGVDVRFGVSTLERWFYAARSASDPVAALRNRLRGDVGRFPSLAPRTIEILTAQYREHPGWTMQLHFDNLRVALKGGDTLLPSYPTIRRYLKAQGMFRQSQPKRATAGAVIARDRLEQLEVRSTAQSLVHGLCQAFMKRGLPRALMTDNGAAMLADETVTGLAALGIVHQTTLPYSPYQNAKQESFWGRIEGRLMAMLEGEEALTLDLLNQATQAWVEQEYHRTRHSEIAATPLARYLAGPNVRRECPGTTALAAAFRIEVVRRQRRSDGTASLAGERFEIPSRFRHLAMVHPRYARWDLTRVDLVDVRTGAA